MTTVYLIQGFIFQERELLSIGYRPIVDAAVMIQRRQCRDMFAGVLSWHDDDPFRCGAGSMTDAFGESNLTTVLLSEQTLSFYKRYDRRPLIRYDFILRDGVWAGTNVGDDCGSGEATCVVTQVTDKMFEMPEQYAEKQP